MLDKRYYYENDRFEAENDKIFSKQWIFACILDEVKSNNDFVTLEIFGKPVVIQNFRGELRCFLNVCTHRFNKIQLDTFGRRALTCGYHCWSFDKDGFPFFVPKKELFSELADDARIHESFCLQKFHVEVCGSFVFILLTEEKETDLKVYLGNHYNKLIEISEYIGEKTHFGSIPHNANWKILIENVLECYHCSTVHKESLYGKLGIGNLPLSEIEYSGAHSSCHFPKVQKKLDVKKRKVLNFLENRSFKHDSFYHLFIFPNLVISSTEGASFYIGQIFPLSPKKTDLKVRFLEPKLDYSQVNPGIREILAEESVRMGYEILDEDKAILENIQKGIEHSNSPGAVNTEEVRIQYFFEQYNQIISHS